MDECAHHGEYIPDGLQPPSEDPILNEEAALHTAALLRYTQRLTAGYLAFFFEEVEAVNARSAVSRTARPPRTSLGAVVIGSLAAFGIITSGAVLALVAAGFMQWRPGIPDLVDEGLPLLLLLGGMLLAGRVAVDVRAHSACSAQRAQRPWSVSWDSWS